MAQVIWGFKNQLRNEGYAVSYHSEMPQTGDVSYCKCVDQPMMQIEASMETPNYTNLELHRLPKPSNFHINCNISLQVQFGGFLEPVSMYCTGYPTKKEFSEFLSCFGVLAPEIQNHENNDERIACQKVLDKLSLTNYQVIGSMRVKMSEEADSQTENSFLLDDDSSIPFTADDISESITEIETSDLDLPPLIRENSGLALLHQRKE